MAVLVSVAFSSILPPSQFPVVKKVDGKQWMRDGHVISRSPSAFNSLSLQLSKGTITAKNLDYHCSVRASFGYPYMCFSNHSVVVCCTRVITGYWFGPDPEDGWGFVEAFLNEVR